MHAGIEFLRKSSHQLVCGFQTAISFLGSAVGTAPYIAKDANVAIYRPGLHC